MLTYKNKSPSKQQHTDEGKNIFSGYYQCLVQNFVAKQEKFIASNDLTSIKYAIDNTHSLSQQLNPHPKILDQIQIIIN